MSIRQISTFLQSKPGHLARILELLQDAGVSVRGYSVSDTGDYGIGRFVVDDVDAAIDAFEEEGIAHAETDVLCLLLEDEPGELGRVMAVLADCGINVSYSYSMISTYIVINADDAGAATAALASTNLVLVSQEDIMRASQLRSAKGGE